jgi:Domain of unknown function (DUF4129)
MAARGRQDGQATGPLARPLAVAAVVFVAIVFAAAGAGAYASSAAGSAVTVPHWMGTIAAILVIDALLILLLGTFRNAGRSGRRGDRAAGVRRRVTTTEVVVSTLVVLAVAGLAILLHHPPNQGKPLPPPQATPTLKALGHPTQDQQDWPLILGVTGATLGGWFAWRVYRARRRGDLAVSTTLEPAETLAAAARVSLEEVLSEPDARRAVILAYRRMEQELGDAGWPRRPSETPYEYLERVFERAGVPSTLGAVLTERYELARFGHHDITETDRETAVRVLRELAQLAAVPT